MAGFGTSKERSIAIGIPGEQFCVQWSDNDEYCTEKESGHAEGGGRHEASRNHEDSHKLRVGILEKRETAHEKYKYNRKLSKWNYSRGLN